MEGFGKLLLSVMILAALWNMEVVDASRTLCPDCVELVNKEVRLHAFDVIAGKYGSVVLTAADGYKRVFIPPEAYDVAMNAVIHGKIMFINTEENKYGIQFRQSL